MATVNTRSPTGRRISFKALAELYNQHLPKKPVIYRFGGARRVFVERRPGAGLYDDSIATLEALYPDSDYS